MRRASLALLILAFVVFAFGIVRWVRLGSQIAEEKEEQTRTVALSWTCRGKKAGRRPVTVHAGRGCTVWSWKLKAEAGSHIPELLSLVLSRLRFSILPGILQNECALTGNRFIIPMKTTFTGPL